MGRWRCVQLLACPRLARLACLRLCGVALDYALTRTHTHGYYTQTKCVRYYMAFPRALALMKALVAAEGRVMDADNRPGGWV